MTQEAIEGLARRRDLPHALLSAAMLLGGLTCAAGSQPGEVYEQTIVASDLDVPRAVAISEGGDIYVVDSGTTQRPNTGRVLMYPRGGDPIELLNGVGNERSAVDGRSVAYGLAGVAIRGGTLLVSLGAGAFVADPLIGPNRLIRLVSNRRPTPLFDYSRFEQDVNPDAAEVGSNAGAIAIDGDGAVWTTDASGNSVIRLSIGGAVLTWAAFPKVDGRSAIPVGVAIGPDASAYVTLFRCAEPTQGRGGIAQVRPDGSSRVVVSGLNNPIGVAFDRFGNLHVLEFGIDYRPNTGRLLRITGSDRRVLVENLSFPTSIAISANDEILITTIGSIAGDVERGGRLLRFRRR